MLTIFIVFGLGAIVGSFLNVCIVRLPLVKSIVFPASHCVHCQKPLAVYDNIPLVSFVLLQGKCRTCHGRISFRYFLVELLTALTFVGFYLRFDTNILLLPYLAMVCCLIVATFADFEHRIIPDEVSIGGMYAGVILSALIPSMHVLSTDDTGFASAFAGGIILVCLLLLLVYPIFCKHLIVEDTTQADRQLKLFILVAFVLALVAQKIAMLISGPISSHLLSLSFSISSFLIGGGVIYIMGLLGDMVFKKESMGGGDIKLMAMLGAFLGWKLAILTFFIAPFLGALYGIVEKIRTKESTIAYGPFLSLAAIISLFYGNMIIDWIIKGGIHL